MDVIWCLKKPMFCAVIAEHRWCYHGAWKWVITGFANNGILTIRTYYGKEQPYISSWPILIGILVASFWEQQSRHILLLDLKIWRES